MLARRAVSLLTPVTPHPNPPKQLELDGIFKCMLLLKKKKYAALTVSETPEGGLTYAKELKGLDLVRALAAGLVGFWRCLGRRMEPVIAPAHALLCGHQYTCVRMCLPALHHTRIKQVRRDWCVLSKATGRFVIDQILSGENRDAVSNHIYIER